MKDETLIGSVVGVLVILALISGILYLNEQNQDINLCQSGVHIITVDTNTTVMNTVVKVEELPSGCIISKDVNKYIRAYDKDKNPLHIGKYNDKGVLINVPKLEANESNIFFLECICPMDDNKNEEEQV
jgi:cell division protein YceG involved in septum cleavage